MMGTDGNQTVYVALLVEGMQSILMTSLSWTAKCLDNMNSAVDVLWTLNDIVEVVFGY